VIELDVITDSDGPGGRFVSALQVGDEVEGIGPRGKITLAPAADWHLFIGDDVAVPAFAAMVEALPAGGRAIVIAEVTDATDETKIDTASGVDLQVIWRHRDGAPAGRSEALLAALAGLTLPGGVGHAYIFGEAQVVNAVRDALTARGLGPEQMSPKAYWGKGRPNASHGEPLKNK
jgi:NADPH-dependent ferric siderophore reductase